MARHAVRISETIYVLHALQKKSTRGSSTLKKEIALIRQRLNKVRAMEADLSQAQEMCLRRLGSLKEKQNANC